MYVAYKCIIIIPKYEHIVNIYLADVIYETVENMNPHTLLEKFSGMQKSHRNAGPFVYSPKSYKCRERVARFIRRHVKETGG